VQHLREEAFQACKTTIRCTVYRGVRRASRRVSVPRRAIAGVCTLRVGCIVRSYGSDLVTSAREAVASPKSTADRQTYQSSESALSQSGRFASRCGFRKAAVRYRSPSTGLWVHYGIREGFSNHTHEHNLPHEQQPQQHAHPHTHSLSHSLATHSLTHTFAHYPHTHSLTHLLAHSLV
jgi:hypothetical protein